MARAWLKKRPCNTRNEDHKCRLWRGGQQRTIRPAQRIKTLVVELEQKLREREIDE